MEDFLLQCDRKGLSDRRKKKYVIFLGKWGKLIDLSNVNLEGCEKMFFAIRNSELSNDTKKDYWSMFKIFAKWSKPDIDLKEYKLQVKTKRKLPEDILSLEEVKKIIITAKTVRDRAMLSLLYDLGCRPGELLNLRIKNLAFDENGLTVSLDGKTGARRIRVITTLNSIRFLKEWLLIHEKDTESYLFGEIKIDRLNQIIKECSKTAGITKRICSYIFRHSRATFLAKYLTEQQMKVYLGWIMDSKMVGTYVHLSGRDLDEKVLELNGENVTSDTSNSLQGNLLQAVLNLSQEVNDLKKKLLIQENSNVINTNRV